MTALASARPDWVVGYEDETWWSRLAQPTLYTSTAGDPLRLVEHAVATGDPNPQALACYRLLLRPGPTATEEVWLRFVDGRPVSAVTTQFVAWTCTQLAEMGTTTPVMVWDNSSWHGSGEVRRWLRAHNQRVHREGGVRIIPCWLSTKSPWLNPIEPKWVHGKRRIVEPARLLTAGEVEERVCATFGCPLCDHLAIPHEVA